MVSIKSMNIIIANRKRFMNGEISKWALASKAGLNLADCAILDVWTDEYIESTRLVDNPDKDQLDEVTEK